MSGEPAPLNEGMSFQIEPIDDLGRVPHRLVATCAHEGVVRSSAGEEGINSKNSKLHQGKTTGRDCRKQPRGSSGR